MNQLVDQTIALYGKLGWKSYFAKIRFWDAPYLEVEKMVPKEGKIIEIGCGEGVFSNFLALSSKDRTVYGLDIDRTRISQADRGLKNTKFVHADAVNANVPPADVLVLFHVLHHLNSPADQEIVLSNCRGKVAKNGKMIIVEVEPKFSIKYLITLFTDHFLVPWLFEKRLYSPIYFRRSKDWVKILNSLGFTCKVKSAEEGMPFSHIILDCTKR